MHGKKSKWQAETNKNKRNTEPQKSHSKQNGKWGKKIETNAELLAHESPTAEGQLVGGWGWCS